MPAVHDQSLTAALSPACNMHGHVKRQSIVMLLQKIKFRLQAPLLYSNVAAPWRRTTLGCPMAVLLPA